MVECYISSIDTFSLEIWLKDHARSFVQ